MATAGAEAVTAEEVLAVAGSTVAVLVVAGSMREALPVAVSAVPVASVGDVLAAALSTALAFVVTVLAGATGVATGGITDFLMMSSSAASDIPGGGIGAIRTDITVTTITHTVTMDTADTRTMDMAGTVSTVAAVTDTAMAADSGIPGVFGRGDKHGT